MSSNNMENTEIILLLLCIFLTKSYAKCEDEQCYKYYENLTNIEKGNIQKVFDGLLEKYGNIDGDLEKLLNRLNQTILKAGISLDEFEEDNNKINNTNSLSNATLLTLLKDVAVVKEEIKTIRDKAKNWLDELVDANKTANITISILVTLDDIKANEHELEKWTNFLESFDKDNYARDIMNIPHSVSEDLVTLENLLNEQYDTSCFKKFHEDLKALFIDLANILKYFNDFEEQIRNILQTADKNKEKANNILSKTNDFLDHEKNFKNIHDLLNETLLLAEDIEKLKNDLNKLLSEEGDIFDGKLKELQEAHEKDLKNLYTKYNFGEMQMLLNELEGINKQIEEVDKNANIDNLIEDIDKYITDIEYYACILEDCHYRKPADAVTTFKCDKKDT